MGARCRKLGPAHVKEALAGFQTAVRLNHDLTEAWFELGQCFNDIKNNDMCVALLRSHARVCICDSYCECGYRALVAFNHAVRCDAKQWSAWRAKASCHAQRREWSDAGAQC